MRTLIWTFYYNNEWYLQYQLKSIEKYLKSDFHLIVFNDAKPTTQSLYSGKLAYNTIKDECDKLNVQHVYIPQNIHTSTNPSQRHMDCIKYAQKNYNLDGYDNILTLDSDVFFIKDFDPNDYSQYSLSGPKQISGVSPLDPHPNKPMIGKDYNMNVYYPHVGFLLINKDIVDVNELNFGNQSNKYVDSCSALYDYIVAHPNEKYYMYDEVNEGGWNGYEIWDNTMIHLREGTNHSGLPLNVYREQRIYQYLEVYNRYN